MTITWPWHILFSIFLSSLFSLFSWCLYSNMSVLTGIQFPLFGMISNAFTKGQDRKLTSVEQISAGFLGGAFSGIACAPMELVLIQQQKFGGSVFGTPAQLVRVHGAGSMYRGFLTSCGREGIFTAGWVEGRGGEWGGEWDGRGMDEGRNVTVMKAWGGNVDWLVGDLFA